MIIALYYHIPIFKKEDKLFLPSYLGVFIDSLASQVTRLYIIMHEACGNEIASCDYELNSTNIEWINLGHKTPAWHRAIFHKKILKGKLKLIEDCNNLIVRSPSPLAPYFNQYCINVKVWFMIVGDYLEGSVHMNKKSFREKMIYLFLKYNDLLFRNQIEKTDVLVNSPGLFDKYKNIAKSIHLIKTTTLSKKDFFYRKNTCNDIKIKLLFTGRIDPAKGLFELFNAMSILVKKGMDVELNIAGWENDPKKPIENQLLQYAHEQAIEQFVNFHGFKSVGNELNQMYRNADLYILPSYHEGFPRTVWEAMANSLPVIVTNVGGIPDQLTHMKDCYMIKSKDVDAIVDSIIIMVKDKVLREYLIKNGIELAKTNTLEEQTLKILKIIEA